MRGLRICFWITVGMIVIAPFLDSDDMGDKGLIGMFIFAAAIGIVKGIREE